jgi:hypothetical protein
VDSLGALRLIIVCSSVILEGAPTVIPSYSVPQTLYRHTTDFGALNAPHTHHLQFHFPLTSPPFHASGSQFTLRCRFLITCQAPVSTRLYWHLVMAVGFIHWEEIGEMSSSREDGLKTMYYFIKFALASFVLIGLPIKEGFT